MRHLPALLFFVTATLTTAPALSTAPAAQRLPAIAKPEHYRLWFEPDLQTDTFALTDDDKRLVVSDYFLNEDDFGKIHFEGDHHVRVIRVFKNGLALDRRFDVDFNTAFATGPARPHGVAMK